jgi:hypothetical protein
MKNIFMTSILIIFMIFSVTANAQDIVTKAIADVWDISSQSFRFSQVASTSGLDVSEETSLTATVHPIVTYTHTTDETPANNIGLSADWYQKTAAANTELGARFAVLATDTTATAENFKIDWMLMNAGATAATKLSLGSTGVLTMVNAATLDNSTAASTLTVTETNIGLTGDTTVTGDLTATSTDILLTGSTSIGLTGDTTVTGDLTATSTDILLTGSTSTTIDSPIIAAIQGTTGGWEIKSYESTTGALSGASGSCAVNVPAGAKLIGTQFRVDTLITSGDGATTWKATYATGSTQIATTGQAFTKNTKVNAFFDTNAATDIMAGTLAITIEPNSNTFSAGVVRCISYASVFTAMDDAS